ncbi:MAG: GNAT family N-acetyltransferase [Bacteroidota bacterium]
MIHIRKAGPEDMEGVHKLVRALAIYEKAENEVSTNPDIYRQDGFGAHPLFECFVAENEEKEIVAIALFYFGYSTWKGKMLYLDDLVVSESQRRKGIGRMLIDRLVAYALEQGASMMKWQVLSWNTSAIEMYKTLGTVFDTEGEWMDCKLYQEQLESWENKA